MRDIKFKCFCNESKVFLNVCHESMFRYLEDDGDDVILLQYTGLKDNNGVEIYEGDVLKVNGVFKQIVSMEIKTSETRGHGECYFSVGIEIASGYGSTHKNQLEVIGNIHQNPELLKGGE